MKSALATLTLVLAATGAFAETPNAVPQTAFVPSRTRADVMAEVLQARATGTLIPGGEIISGEAGIVPAPTLSSKTRAQIRSEIPRDNLQQLRKSGYQPA